MSHTIDVMEEENRKLQSINKIVEDELRKQEQKLEAIRTHWKNQPSPEQTSGNVHGFLQAHSAWLDGFKEVLGVE